MTNRLILKFEQCDEQTINGLRRVVGFVEGRSIPTLLDVADLSANPRSANTFPLERINVVSSRVIGINPIWPVDTSCF